MAMGQRLFMTTAIGGFLLLAGCGGEPAGELDAETARDGSRPAAEARSGAGSGGETIADTITDASTAFLALADAHASKILAVSPALATELGVSEARAGSGFLSDLGGYGLEAHQRARSLNDSLLQDLRAIDPDALNQTARLHYDVLRNAYEAAARRNGFAFGGATPIGASDPNSGSSWAITPYFVTQLTGAHLYLPRMLQTEHPLTNKEDAEAYVARLNDFGRAFDEVIETVDGDAAAGIVPPLFIVDGIIGNIDGLTEVMPAQNPMALVFSQKLSAMDGLSDDERAALLGAAQEAIETVVYPAFSRLRETFAAMRETTDNNAGIWRLGDEGAAFYQNALNAYGAQGKTGDDVHEIGLAEVRRIHAEMDGLLTSIGYDSGDVGARMLALAEEPDNTYPNTDDGREALLQSLREQIGAIMEIAPDWFQTLPPQAVEVRRIPVHEQDSSPGGYYSGPSLDGSRPGTYWINLKDTGDNPKHGLKTLTYHEAVPGHHFSISSQRAIEDMPIMRTILGFSEYEEGWALYGEKLAREMGMYEGDPRGDLGRLQAELFRAARLVVDTGLHVKQWTREEAIDWMVAATGESRASVTREVERYAAVPGQACAYKLGMLAIEAMRARAEAALGEAFDIKAFHDVILSGGSMPMDILDRRVDAWITAAQAE